MGWKKIWNNFIHTLESCWLCIRFPFLYPRNVWTGKPCCIIPTYTELDEMEPGWRKAFGVQMCKELKAQLKKEHYLYKYRITQIKEKWGYLRWYDEGHSDAVNKIINKYEDISWNTCLICGKPATKIKAGWISPYCDECFPKNAIVYMKKWKNGKWHETREYKRKTTNC